MAKDFPYQHGFSEQEQKRLRRQARFAEYSVYQSVNLSGVRRLLEVGCGVGAQSEIILRRFPDLHLTGIDLSERQLEGARSALGGSAVARGRFDILRMDATKTTFKSGEFDGAFLCWILEHVSAPRRVLGEVRRVLAPGSVVYITEVMNSSFFLDPYSPNTWRYWMAFNDYQLENGGDPFVGAKLGNLLMQSGFRDIETTVKTWHLDNRRPVHRKEIIEHWAELLLSASDQLVTAGKVSLEVVEGMKAELDNVASDPNAVFFDCFIQAKARV